MFEELNQSDIILDEQVTALKQAHIPSTKNNEKKLKEFQALLQSDQSFYQSPQQLPPVHEIVKILPIEPTLFAYEVLESVLLNESMEEQSAQAIFLLILKWGNYIQKENIFLLGFSDVKFENSMKQMLKYKTINKPSNISKLMLHLLDRPLSKNTYNPKLKGIDSQTLNIAFSEFIFLIELSSQSQYLNTFKNIQRWISMIIDYNLLTISLNNEIQSKCKKILEIVSLKMEFLESIQLIQQSDIEFIKTKKDQKKKVTIINF